MKRSCHRHTQVFDLPVAAMIAEVRIPTMPVGYSDLIPATIPF